MTSTSTVPQSVGTSTPDADARFAAAVEDFLRAYEAAWTEWASATIANVVVEQFDTTETLSEDALVCLKRRCGTAVRATSTSLRSARPFVLRPDHWQEKPPFDNRTARLEVEVTWQRLPESLVAILEDAGYVVPETSLPFSGGAALLAYSQATRVLVAAGRAVADAAARDRKLRRDAARASARSRWAGA